MNNDKPKIIPSVEFTVKFTLTENEARALDALAGYGADAFLKVFYKHLGIAYMKPFEKDLRQLFEKVQELKPAIRNINDARKKLGLPSNTRL
jgi:hypothetical protein